MTVKEIYTKYNIPPNLQGHLFRVTKLALFICDHWKGPELDREVIKQAGLLHDLGNIVKFDFVNHPEFLGKEQKNVKKWIKVQREMIRRYGKDDHEALSNILKELKVDDNIYQLIMSKESKNSKKMASGNNWELKIIHYADSRSGPFEIIPLNTRLDEVLRRSEKYQHLDLPGLIEACNQIEEQLQETTSIDITKIDENSSKINPSKLLNEVIT